MKRFHKPSGRKIPLVNNKGNVMHVPGNLTLGQMARMGFGRMRIVPVDTPLEENEWTTVNQPDTPVPPPNSP